MPSSSSASIWVLSPNERVSGKPPYKSGLSSPSYMITRRGMVSGSNPIWVQRVPLSPSATAQSFCTSCSAEDHPFSHAQKFRKANEVFPKEQNPTDSVDQEEQLHEWIPSAPPWLKRSMRSAAPPHNSASGSQPAAHRLSLGCLQPLLGK